jgi:hypothetical protein
MGLVTRHEHQKGQLSLRPLRRTDFLRHRSASHWWLLRYRWEFNCLRYVLEIAIPPRPSTLPYDPQAGHARLWPPLGNSGLRGHCRQRLLTATFRRRRVQKHTTIHRSVPMIAIRLFPLRLGQILYIRHAMPKESHTPNRRRSYDATRYKYCFCSRPKRNGDFDS